MGPVCVRLLHASPKDLLTDATAQTVHSSAHVLGLHHCVAAMAMYVTSTFFANVTLSPLLAHFDAAQAVDNPEGGWAVGGPRPCKIASMHGGCQHI